MADQLLPTPPTPCHDTLRENDRGGVSDTVIDFNIPVVDIGSPDKNLVISQIENACQNYGVFQVVNHGITEPMQRQVIGIGMFFKLPPEEKAKLYSKISEMVPNGGQPRDVAEKSSNGPMIRLGLEKVMTFVAITAMLQLMASGLGMVMSLWAVMMLPKNYLGFITLMLFFQGIHIFCHSSKLVLYRMHDMKPLPYPICFINWLFYWIDLISVITSGVLSVTGLAYLLHAHKLPKNSGETEALALYVFYVLGISEVLVFLSARTIWNIKYCQLLKKFEDKYSLEESDMELVKRFIYDFHSKIMEDGKIIEAFKMNVVTYVEEIHDSSSGEEQFRAANLLNALRKIDTCHCTLHAQGVSVLHRISLLLTDTALDGDDKWLWLVPKRK